MAKKAWMKPRDGESVGQTNARLAKTCYGCGTEFPSVQKTDDHEQICPKTTEGRRKKR